MTDQEREIDRVIKYIRSCREEGIDTTITIDKRKNHFILNALEEVLQYRSIGTVEECRQVMEKNKEKEPVLIYKRDRLIIGKCPNCNRKVSYKYERRFCNKCGQKLDWGREE